MSTGTRQSILTVDPHPRHIRFRISKTCGRDGKPLHGHWHPDPEVQPARYLHIERVDGIDCLSGFLSPDAFTHVMRALVSSEYDTPNWCEKCHLAGHDGCCRCEIACNE
jgi:hypothetical protein